ncbi:MAG: M18 family aminopeptidase [bacterium]
MPKTKTPPVDKPLADKPPADQSAASHDAIDSLLRYLNDSPTPFHAVANAVARLREAGYVEVDEGAPWQRADERERGFAPSKSFVVRNGSSLVAADLRRAPADAGLRMVGAHTDSPCLRVKPSAIARSHGYATLAVEVYGGALLAPWFDRGLGLAGRVTLRDADGALRNRLINIARPIAFIPSLAIHFDRNVNDGRGINKQRELPALLCRLERDLDRNDSPPNFEQLLLDELARDDSKSRERDARILGFELSLYDRQPAELVGLGGEFIASARLDNLLSCHAGIEALLAADGDGNKVLVLNDHEEVGSASSSGADGPFLRSVLQRLCGGEESLARALNHSMMISADNAHGVHPNYADKHEPAHRPLMNDGPAIKINSDQRYATNSETEALFRRVCELHRLPVQTIVARSDMACGSTIGPITAARLGVRTIDIGVPQLGMHSIRELAGARDQRTLVAALKGFYQLADRDWPF